MRTRFLVLIAVLAIIVAACGDGSPANETPAPQSTPSTPSTPSALSTPSTLSTETAATVTHVVLADGPQRLAFVSDRDGLFRLYTMAPDGSDIRQVSPTEVSRFSPYSVSRDGTQIAAVGDPAGGVAAPHLQRIDVLGGATFDLGQAPSSDSDMIVPAFQWQADDGAIPAFNSFICYAFPSGGGEIVERDLDECVESAAKADRPGGGTALIFGTGLFVASQSDPNNPRQIDTVVPATASRDGLSGLAYLALQTFGLWRPLFSPDGKQIAYLDGDAGDGRGGLAVIGADGSGGRLVVEARKNDLLVPGAWSADGRQVFVSGLDTSSSIRVVDVATGASRLLLGEDGHTYMYPRWVVESPAPVRAASAPADTSKTADLKADLRDAPGRLVYDGGQYGFRGQFTARPDGTDERMIAARVPYGAVSSDDGRWMVYTPGTILDTTTGATKSFAGGNAPSISPDGRKVAFWIDGQRANTAAPPEVILVVQDLETATRTEVYRGLGAGYDANVEAAWSPDGRRLAFFQMLPAEREDTNQRWDLSIVDAEGGSITVLGSLTSQLNASGPLAWSPDGTRVAFDDDILRVADVDARTIRDYEVYADSVAWSPDGAQIAVHGGGLLLVESASGKARRLTSDLGGAVEYPPAWSPDGRWLAYVGSDDTLRVLEVASSAILRLPNEVDEIIWARD